MKIYSGMKYALYNYKMQKELFGRGLRLKCPGDGIPGTPEEVPIGTCGQCVFYLPFGTDYNCGYLIRRVRKSSGCCRHFQSLTMFPLKER